MRAGLIGRKLGMSRIFTEDGKSVAVTLVKVGPCPVIGLKTSDKNGYDAVQLGFEDAKPSRVKKPVRGIFAKANVPPQRILKEFRVTDTGEYEVGSSLSLDRFEAGGRVDVTGKSVGKGFAGGMKRWGFRGGRATHGAHLTHRSPGSIGQCQTPGRVFKNKKMAGHMGDENVTVMGLTVASVDLERNLLVLKGSVPGSKGSVLFIRDAVKAVRK
ncbi:50S ribosomal protein L3 [Candidatus Magnetaquicoccaceae bacterium FCR-1]|uniref:Large ribosomal subunit protein uL3 n=1 Tax=Candidatus Magnetaquiglobus chichijimensis TaxID=3141448 RepID=A0ABQ0CAW0_9PROT